MHVFRAIKANNCEKSISVEKELTIEFTFAIKTNNCEKSVSVEKELTIDFTLAIKSNNCEKSISAEKDKLTIEFTLTTQGQTAVEALLSLQMTIDAAVILFLANFSIEIKRKNFIFDIAPFS